MPNTKNYMDLSIDELTFHAMNRDGLAQLALAAQYFEMFLNEKATDNLIQAYKWASVGAATCIEGSHMARSLRTLIDEVVLQYPYHINAYQETKALLTELTSLELKEIENYLMDDNDWMFELWQWEENHSLSAFCCREKKGLIELETLIFAENELGGVLLPLSLAKLPNLKRLIIEKNGLTELPEVIGQLVKLRSLTYIGNAVENEFIALNKLRDLQALNLSNNGLKKIPPEIFQLENLRELNLSGNPIELLPDEICRLEKLELLDLSDTKIAIFPDCCLTQLKNLSFLLLPESL